MRILVRSTVNLKGAPAGRIVNVDSEDSRIRLLLANEYLVPVEIPPWELRAILRSEAEGEEPASVEVVEALSEAAEDAEQHPGIEGFPGG
jgi:hypothetical protein